MGKKKLIIPQEVPLCGTCSFWDGERQVDEETQLVVLTENALGKCLAVEKPRSALHARKSRQSCLWEDLSLNESESVLYSEEKEQKIDFSKK